MTSVKAYTDVDGKTLPIPPLEELRAKDWARLPHDRYVAVEAWWIHANHPGFGLDAEHTADTMRDAGFTEREIRDVLLTLIGGCPGQDEQRALTNFLVQLVHKLEDVA